MTDPHSSPGLCIIVPAYNEEDVLDALHARLTQVLSVLPYPWQVLYVREQHRFMKGIFAWVGFPQLAVPYHRDSRLAGHTKWNYWKLWNFALEGITSFSTIPLKIATYAGLLNALFAFSYGLFMVVDTLLYGNPVPGYPSLLVVTLFLGGLQLMAIGVVGEYVGRMFDEVKGRPLYLLKTCRVPPPLR